MAFALLQTQKCALFKVDLILLSIFSLNKVNIKNTIDILHNFFVWLQLIKVVESNIVMLKRD